MISSGYPAARRCHSCVQVKDGEQDFTPGSTCMDCISEAHFTLSLIRGVYMWGLQRRGDPVWPVEAEPADVPVVQVACRHARTSVLPLCCSHSGMWNTIRLVSYSPVWGEILKWSVGNCNLMILDTNMKLSSSGRMHVCPRRSRQHVWESKNWLLVQSVVGGTQPAGNVLGETTENLPSHSSAVHPPAAWPGTDTHADPATQIDGSSNAGGQESVRKG